MINVGSTPFLGQNISFGKLKIDSSGMSKGLSDFANSNESVMSQLLDKAQLDGFVRAVPGSYAHPDVSNVGEIIISTHPQTLLDKAKKALGLLPKVSSDFDLPYLYGGKVFRTGFKTPESSRACAVAYVEKAIRKIANNSKPKTLN